MQPHNKYQVLQTNVNDYLSILSPLSQQNRTCRNREYHVQISWVLRAIVRVRIAFGAPAI